MTRHTAKLALLVSVLGVLVGAALAGCAPQVRVETGERIVCTYGEIVTDTVKAIQVPADKADSYHIVTKTVTCDLHRQCEVLYAAAQDAIASGDLDTAEARLNEVVALDSSFRNAQEQLDAINAGKKPDRDPNVTISPGTSSSANSGGSSGSGSNSGGGSGNDASAGPDPVPVGPVAGLMPWVPETLPGYKGGAVIADVFALTRQYQPTAAMPTDALTIVVEQYADAASARQAIKHSIAFNYPEDAANATVEGRSVRFGTDGKRFATVAWAEGNLLVVIEGSAKSRKPGDLRPHLMTLASEVIK